MQVAEIFDLNIGFILANYFTISADSTCLWDHRDTSKDTTRCWTIFILGFAFSRELHATESQSNVQSTEVSDGARNEHHQLNLQYKFTSGQATTDYLGNAVGCRPVETIQPFLLKTETIPLLSVPGSHCQKHRFWGMVGHSELLLLLLCSLSC